MIYYANNGLNFLHFFGGYTQKHHDFKNHGVLKC